MKYSKFLFIKILACVIITNYSIGQSTFNLTEGSRVNIAPGTNLNNDNLKIGTGSQLINWGKLTVDGVLVNDAGTPGLIIKSNALGYGSLMHNNIGVEATVEQYLESERWHLVSPPVLESTIEIFTDLYLKQWEEPFGDWHYMVDPLNWPIGATYGYATWPSDQTTGSATVNYEGYLINGDAGYVFLSYTENTISPGWNLVGNPYPSPVEWNQDWFIHNLTGWAVVYDNGTYKGWNPWMPAGEQSYNGKTDGFIAPGQGFWVHSVQSDAYLVAPQSARAHDNVEFLKDSEVSEHQSLHIEVSANEYTDETVILFMEDALTGTDPLFDLEKHMNVAEAPIIYSVPESGKPHGVNVLPLDWVENNSPAVIPLGFEIVPPTLCELIVKGIEKFDPELPIYLEDLKEDKLQNLFENNTYTFNASEEDDKMRFLLHFGEPAQAKEFENDILIYSYNNCVYVKSPPEISGNAFIYDLLGKEILSFSLNEELTKRIIPNTGGYYIVKVISQERIETQKVFINN